MCDSTGKKFEDMSKDEQLKDMMENMGKYMKGATDEDTSALMMNVMPKMMGNGMSMMKKMCQMMGSNMLDDSQKDMCGEGASSCCGDSKESKANDYATAEIKSLFDDWVLQVQEEISRYQKENKNASRKDIAEYLKISEESLNFFLENKKDASSSCSCGSSCDTADGDIGKAEYETIKLEKTKNICPMCEDYAIEQKEKPIVIMSCEGACLRGEVSRRAANLICHSLIPDKTVRLCLGGAYTKDGGQRNLVRNAKKVVALEGCFIKCASRMMKGVVQDVDPQIIITDKLFDFDTKIFGINEMSEEDIKNNSLTVARKIAEQL